MSQGGAIIGVIGGCVGVLKVTQAHLANIFPTNKGPLHLSGGIKKLSAFRQGMNLGTKWAILVMWD